MGDISKTFQIYFFVIDNAWISIKISRMFAYRGSIDDILALF